MTSLVDNLKPYGPDDVPLIERQMLGLGGYIVSGQDATGWVDGRNLGGIGTPQWPYAYSIESLTLSANKNCKILYYVGTNNQAYGSVPGASAPLAQHTAILAPGVPHVIPFKTLLRGGYHGGGNLVHNAIFDADKTNFHLSLSPSGFRFSDDLDLGARPILFIGDSTWDGVGPTVRNDLIPWKIRNYYRNKNIRVRMACRAISGSTTGTHDILRSAGHYDYERPAAIFYNLGINDASQSIATATTRDNIAKMIAWKRAQYPDIPLVICGTTPVENSGATGEATLATIRANIAADVAATNDPKVKYVSLAGAFDRAAAANYVGTDTAGVRVHPNQTGINQVWDGGYSGFGGFKAWLDANLPTL